MTDEQNIDESRIREKRLGREIPGQNSPVNKEFIDAVPEEVL